MSKQRLFYLDALKAFAIISVIMGHLCLFCFWKGFDYKSDMSLLVNLYHMPLFMMMSGFVTDYEYFSIGKRIKILIPFFFFGLLYTMFSGMSLPTFFTSESKNGYWFLWAIVIFFIFLYIIRRVRINLAVGIIIVELLFVALHFFFRRTLVGTTISTDHLWFLWPFFSLGILFKRGGFEWIRKRKAIIIPLSMILVCLLAFPLFKTESESVFKLINFLIAFPITVILILLFYYAEKRFKGKDFMFKSQIKSIGEIIGVNTLQIYVIHYFILEVMNLNFVSSFMIENNLYFMEYIISPVLSILIAYACVYMANIIYMLRLGVLFGR